MKMQKRRLPRFFVKSPKRFLLVLDVGTTGVKAFVFDKDRTVLAKSYRRYGKFSPRTGWVEQDPFELLAASREVIEEAVLKSRIPPKKFYGFGMTNQRETTILWHRKTGEPAHPAIVWEDVRTASACRWIRLHSGKAVRDRTGLPVDPYFSATKIRWILDHAPIAKAWLSDRMLAFGTVDSWLLWNLCCAHPHLTDETNASRTLLFNLKTLQWDDHLLRIFGVPKSVLPKVFPSHSLFGALDRGVMGAALPVLAVCGDQQSSLFAAIRQETAPGTSSVGVTKATFGTGTFVMQVVGTKFLAKPGWFTTLVPGSGRPLYALEAKINDSGKRVDAFLAHPKKLRVFLSDLSKDVSKQLRRLPLEPAEIVIDGGITRAKILSSLLEGFSGIPVRPAEIFDGTALGIARLLQEPF